jgi:WD40 repeat protein/DNA repair exonuclease SbcCD ATPase subunit
MNLAPSLLFAVLATSLHAEDKVTYADHARAIMENKCFSCHNPDKKKGDLDLTSYAGVVTGGGSGVIVDAGNSGGSKLIGTITKKTEPFMPPEGAPLGEADIAVLKKWIDGGILDTSSSIARKSTKPKVELTVASGSGKPSGPIAKPDNILQEPVIVTPRTTAITAMAASPWTGLLAVAVPKQILLYDTDTRLLVGILPYTEGYARSLRFSRSGALLVMGGGKGGKFGQAVVWDVKTGKRITEVGKEFDTVMCADITSDHKKIAIGSPSKKVKVYDTATGEELYTIGRHTNWILGTAFSPDGILLATSDRDGNVFVWEAEGGGEFFLLGQHKGGAAIDLAWRSDSNILASCSRDGTIILWEMNEGKQLKTWTAHAGGVESVSFTPDGRLVSCGQDGLTRVWDMNGTKLSETASQGDIVSKTAALYDDKLCVTGNWRGELRFFDLKSGAEVGQASANPGLISTRIAQAEARIVELSNKIIPTKEAVKAAEVTAKAAADALAKAKADMAANESRKNALPGEIKATQEQLTKDRASQVQLAKDREVRIAALKTFAAKQLKIAELDKQLAPLTAEVAKLPAVSAAVASSTAAVEAGKKELAANAAAPAIVAKLKSLQDALASATAAQGVATQAKQKAAALSAQLAPLKQQLGAAPAPIADLDKAIADIATKIKDHGTAITAKNAELPKTIAEAKAWPDRLKGAEAAVPKANEAVAAAQAAATATTTELAIMQRAVPSLKAAQFNVGVLAEKDKLTKLEADFQSFTDGVADNESAKIAAAKSIEDSKKAIAQSIAAQPALDAKAKQSLAELDPIEKHFTTTKSASDQAAAKVDEQKKILAAKEAELAGFVKVKDDGITSANKAIVEIRKQIEAHKKSVATAITKVAEPNKRVERQRAEVATAEAALTTAKQGQTAAKVSADQASKLIAAQQDELNKAITAMTAVEKDLVAKRPSLAKAVGLVQPAKTAAAAKEKELAAANTAKLPTAAALAQQLTDLRNKVATAEKDAGVITAAVKTAEQTIAASTTAIATMRKTFAAAKSAGAQAQQAYNTANLAVGKAERSLAERKNALTVAEKDAAAPRGNLASSQANMDGAVKALATKQAEPATLEKALVEKSAPVKASMELAKTALPALEKALAETSAKTAADQKILETKRTVVGTAQAEADANKKKKVTAEQTIIAATKEIPERATNIAEGKAELAKLQPQLAPMRAKVKQLSDQFIALLPK